MQDFTGVPAVVDLAAMRDGITRLGGNPQKVNPLVPVDLVIDHSVMVDVFGTPRRAGEERRHRVRAQRRALPLPALGPGRVRQFPRGAARHRHLPPGEPGISRPDRLDLAPTGGTPSPIRTRCTAPTATPPWSTACGILGWGVGGIEAEAAMLGQPIAMLIPDVIGFRLTGKLPEGATATDLVLTVTQMLRKQGRGRQVRRILRPRPGRAGAAGPRHHRQHGPGIRRHLRLLPGRQGRRSTTCA